MCSLFLFFLFFLIIFPKASRTIFESKEGEPQRVDLKKKKISLSLNIKNTKLIQFQKKRKKNAENVDRTRDLQIFSLTLSQWVSRSFPFSNIIIDCHLSPLRSRDNEATRGLSHMTTSGNGGARKRWTQDETQLYEKIVLEKPSITPSLLQKLYFKD